MHIKYLFKINSVHVLTDLGIFLFADHYEQSKSCLEIIQSFFKHTLQWRPRAGVKGRTAISTRFTNNLFNHYA